MKFSAFIFAAEDDVPQQMRYSFILDTARYLDVHGYEAIWTPERHFQEFGGSFPNPAVLSAALAAVTQRLGLRAGSVVAPHHHPVRIAEEWALVDQLSQGRAGICLAAGWHKRDFVFYPNNFERRKAVLYESVGAVRDLWAGRCMSFRAADEELEVRAYPSPYLREIPLWLVYSSDPEIWDKAGALGCNVLSLLNDWTLLENGVGAYRRARDAAGLEPAGGCVTVAMHAFVGDDDASVRSIVEAPLKRYLRTFLRARTDNKRLSSEQAPITEEESELILNATFEDLFHNRSLLGDVRRCRRILERLQRLGVGEVAALIDFGVEFSQVRAALDRLTDLKQAFQAAGGSPAQPYVDESAPAAPAKAPPPRRPVPAGFAQYFDRR
jgi:natural product biosynthesis luciferase-like monooxygenase protein